MRERLTAVFRSKTRAEWVDLLEGTDVCFAPVLDMAEAPAHPHNLARGTFIEVDGVPQPAPAPRFSRTSPTVAAAPAAPGQDSEQVLADWGWSHDAIETLKAAKLI
jgi:alpha-methylacyl-CoA racemase